MENYANFHESSLNAGFFVIINKNRLIIKVFLKMILLIKQNLVEIRFMYKKGEL